LAAWPERSRWDVAAFRVTVATPLHQQFTAVRAPALRPAGCRPSPWRLSAISAAAGSPTHLARRVFFRERTPHHQSTTPVYRPQAPRRNPPSPRPLSKTAPQAHPPQPPPRATRRSAGPPSRPEHHARTAQRAEGAAPVYRQPPHTERLRRVLSASPGQLQGGRHTGRQRGRARRGPPAYRSFGSRTRSP